MTKHISRPATDFNAAFRGEAPRDETERLEAEQADYLASPEGGGGEVITGPDEWFNRSAWDAPTHKLRRSLARFVESRNAAKDEPAAPGLFMVARPKSVFEQYARRYIERGYSPIPRWLGEDGHEHFPIGWSNYCAERAPDELIEKWSRIPDAMIALCCGYGGLTVFDADTKIEEQQQAILSALPAFDIGRFGSKGFALLTLYHEPQKFFNIWTGPREKSVKAVEIKGLGQNITVPPSIHFKTGEPYRWLDPHTGEPFGELPPLGMLPRLTEDNLRMVREAMAPWATPPRPEPARRSAGNGFNPKGDKRYGAWYRARLRNQVVQISGLTEGRPTALFNAACALGAGVHHRFIPQSEFEDELLDACHTNGLLRREGRPALLASIHSGLRKSENDDLPDLGEGKPKPKSKRKANGAAEAPQDADKPTGQGWENAKPKGLAAARKSWEEDNGGGGGNGGATDASAPQPQPEADADGRPRLEVVSADPDLTVAEVRGVLAKAGCFFERGPIPVMLAHDKSLGGLVAHPVTGEVVILETHKRSRPWALRKIEGQWIEVDIQLPKHVAVMYLRDLGNWQLPVLNGIASGPLLLDDGTIRTAAGYDESTGLWCQNVPDVAYLVPDKPTLEEAKTALLAIRRVFRTFCFADATTIKEGELTCVDLTAPMGLDESSLLIALQTGVCRPSLWLAPGIITRAPPESGSGTGKGLLARAICEIAYGIQPPAFTAGSPEEMEKRIATRLISASQAILLDNLNDTNFTSEQLESSMTERPSMVRLFGKLKDVPVNSSALVILTGNGLDVSKDAVRRFPMVINLDAQMEAPESRDLYDGDFKAEVKERRGELLAHVLTIWRYGRTKKLKRGLPLGSFNTWERWCRDPLIALGCKDPVERIEAMKAQDPHRQKLNAIFMEWYGSHVSDPVTAWELNNAVKALLIEDKDKRTRQAITAKVNKLAGARVAGYVLTRIPSDSKWDPDKFTLETAEEAKKRAEGLF